MIAAEWDNMGPVNDSISWQIIICLIQIGFVFMTSRTIGLKEAIKSLQLASVVWFHVFKSSLFLFSLSLCATYYRSVNYPRTSLRWRKQHVSHKGRRPSKPNCRGQTDRAQLRVKQFISFCLPFLGIFLTNTPHPGKFLSLPLLVICGFRLPTKLCASKGASGKCHFKLHPVRKSPAPS